MSTRKRKPADKSRPTYRVTRVEQNDENDLEKQKEQAKKLLEENEKNGQEWFDKELDKNLKNIK